MENVVTNCSDEQTHPYYFPPLEKTLTCSTSAWGSSGGLCSGCWGDSPLPFTCAPQAQHPPNFRTFGVISPEGLSNADLPSHPSPNDRWLVGFPLETALNQFGHWILRKHCSRRGPPRDQPPRPLREGPPISSPQTTVFFRVPLCAKEGRSKAVLLTWLRKRIEMEGQGWNSVSHPSCLRGLSEPQAALGMKSCAPPLPPRVSNPT